MNQTQESRAMFVARLENMQKNGDNWLTITAVLALLNDCDMLANRAAKNPNVQPKGTEPPGWVGPELAPESMTELAVAIGELSQAMGSPCVMGRAPQTLKSQTVRMAAFRLKEAPSPAPGAVAWRFRTSGGQWSITTDATDAAYYVKQPAWECEPLVVQASAVPHGKEQTLMALEGAPIVQAIRAWIDAHKARHGGASPTDDQVIEAAHQDPPFSIDL